MAKNYDASQVGVEYVRVPAFTVDYPTPGNARVEAQEVLAIKTAGGAIKVTERFSTPLAFRIQEHQMTETFPLINPETGAALPGNPTMTYGQLMVGITSAIRKAQIARDTPPIVTTPTEPESP